MMTIGFTAILLGLAAIIYPLRNNKFYLLNAALIIGAAYFFENNCFRVTNIFNYKTLLLFLLFWIVATNFTTFVAYGVDKRAAIKKTWRVPEKDLHMLEFLGGWIGAWVGQKFFRHKTAKKSYQAMYKLMIVLEFLAIWGLLRFFNLF